VEVAAVLSKTKQHLIIAIAILLLAEGCRWDNGIPTDLINHLAIHGIDLRASGSQAPLFGRSGFVFFDRNPALEGKIVTKFQLEKIAPGDPRFSFYAGQTVEKPVSLWGIGGRPDNLKLKDGAQFEHFYLLITEKRCYLFAEYAYG
jgi:hypothetical protein